MVVGSVKVRIFATVFVDLFVWLWGLAGIQYLDITELEKHIQWLNTKMEIYKIDEIGQEIAIS